MNINPFTLAILRAIEERERELQQQHHEAAWRDPDPVWTLDDWYITLADACELGHWYAQEAPR